MTKIEWTTKHNEWKNERTYHAQVGEVKITINKKGREYQVTYYTGTPRDDNFKTRTEFDTFTKLSQAKNRAELALGLSETTGSNIFF